jgi:hypothetical protein
MSIELALQERNKVGVIKDININHESMSNKHMTAPNPTRSHKSKIKLEHSNAVFMQI